MVSFELGGCCVSFSVNLALFPLDLCQLVTRNRLRGEKDWICNSWYWLLSLLLVECLKWIEDGSFVSYGC